MCFCVSDIDGEFKRALAKLVPLLLAPDRLVEKEIGGNKVTCRDLLEYFKVLQDFSPVIFTLRDHRSINIKPQMIHSAAKKITNFRVNKTTQNCFLFFARVDTDLDGLIMHSGIP